MSCAWERCAELLQEREPKRKKKLVHVADYARWYGRNKRVGYSPWIDPPRKKKKK